MSLVVEAGELLECFQWTEEPDLDLVADEIADVVLYAVQLSRVAGVDIAEAVMAKLQRNHLRTWDDEHA
jgi:NTP pyrophosphatase (non-canonical NTP hydrolase)